MPSVLVGGIVAMTAVVVAVVIDDALLGLLAAVGAEGRIGASGPLLVVVVGHRSTVPFSKYPPGVSTDGNDGTPLGYSRQHCVP